MARKTSEPASVPPPPSADNYPLGYVQPGWSFSGADVPPDSADEPVVWGVDPGGWTVTEDKEN